MQTAKRFLLEDAAAAAGPAPIVARHVDAHSPRRPEAENFIREVFQRHHAAHVRAFAPSLVLLEQSSRLIAAAGWRSAAAEPLFLENYLDEPIETLVERLCGQPVARSRIVEVGHLASQKPGGSLQVILTLTRHLHQFGHEWVVFTATRELIGIFAKLGLPLLALAKADPARLGAQARDWGRYYDTQPIVVAGRIRIALDRIGANA